MERKFRNPRPLGGERAGKRQGKRKMRFFWLVDHRLGLGVNVFRRSKVARFALSR